jgi:hypothetical protein
MSDRITDSEHQDPLRDYPKVFRDREELRSRCKHLKAALYSAAVIIAGLAIGCVTSTFFRIVAESKLRHVQLQLSAQETETRQRIESARLILKATTALWMQSDDWCWEKYYKSSGDFELSSWYSYQAEQEQKEVDALYVHINTIIKDTCESMLMTWSAMTSGISHEDFAVHCR